MPWFLYQLSFVNWLCSGAHFSLFHLSSYILQADSTCMLIDHQISFPFCPVIFCAPLWFFCANRFAGERGHVHRLIAQAQGQVFCLPFLLWYLRRWWCPCTVEPPVLQPIVVMLHYKDCYTYSADNCQVWWYIGNQPTFCVVNNTSAECLCTGR